MIMRLGLALWRLVSFAVTPMLIGAGIGFFHGEIVARDWERPAQTAFAEGASSIGALVGLVLGPALYFLLLRRRVSVEDLALVVSCTAIIGGLVSLTGAEVVIPIVNIAVTIFASLTIVKDPKESIVR